MLEENNKKRLRRLEQRDRQGRKQLFALGARVQNAEGRIGRVDAVYADLEAAADAFIIPDEGEWYAGLQPPAVTGREGHWYSLIVEDEGSVLEGELDLRAV